MADDSDLARLLPDPPPPRPAARDAAIAAGMRRFDGVADPAPVVAAGGAPDRRPTRWLSGKQIGAFATIVFVAGISLSVALNRPGGLQPGKVEQPSQVTAPRPAPAPSSVSAPNPTDTSTAAPVVSDNAAVTKPAPVAKPDQTIPNPVTSAALDTSSKEVDRRGSPDRTPSAPAPASPPPPPSPAAMDRWSARAAPAEPPPAAADQRSIIVTGSRVQSKKSYSASPVTVVSREGDEESGGNDIVITGQKAGRPNPYAARGDWNACTVIDPEESLRGCKSLLGIGAKGPAGEAGARLSDGLALAWRGDWDGAIAAFDQAVALKPKSAIAYLNRGLAYQRKGDAAHAAADIDLAIKYAPYAARGYYIRGVLRREQGNRRGANADATRAVELDSGYPDPVQ